MAKKLIQVVYEVNDAALIKAQKSLQGNEAAAKKADDQVKKYGKDAEIAGNQASKSFGNLGNIWKGLIAIGIVTFVGNLAKKTFELGVKQEQLNIAFTTFLGSAEKARKLLAELNKFALVTPFTPDQVNNAAKALLAFGTRAEEIIPTLKMLGDISAGTGKDLTELSIIFGQIKSTGRLMGQDLLQLINAGFNPLQIISKETGRSMMALKKDMENGAISFEMVEAAMKKATSAGGLFFDLTAKQAESVGGQLSNISGNINEILKNLFTASTGPIKNFVANLVLVTEGFIRMSENADQALFRVRTEKMAKTVEDFEAYAKSIGDVNKAYDQEIQALGVEEAKLRERNALISQGTGFLKEHSENKDRIRAIKLEREALDEYIKSLKEGNDLKWVNELAKSQEKQAEALKRLNKLRIDQTEGDINITLPPVDLAARGLFGFTIDEANEALEAELEAQENADAELLALKQQGDINEIEAEAKKQKTIEELKQHAFDVGMDLIGQALFMSIDANAREVETRVQRQHALEGLSEEERKLKLKEFAEADQLRKEQAKREQAVTIKKILIESALNAVKALGLPPIPGVNFLAAGLAIGQGIAMATIVKATGFKEGVIGLDGPGTGTSDSIPARLSKGESVITAKATARSHNLLEAINDHRIDDRILKGLKVTAGGVTVINDNAAVAKAIRDKEEPDYYEQGHFVNKIIKKGETLKQHIRAKSFSK